MKHMREDDKNKNKKSICFFEAAVKYLGNYVMRSQPTGTPNKILILIL